MILRLGEALTAWSVRMPRQEEAETHGSASLHCGGGVKYAFDGFALDTGTRRLLRNDEELHLSPKAFDLLLVLIENRSRAMSRAQLQKHLWPDTFVLDTNLASLVAEIRRALADTADDPRFVRTMHRFGYWFIGDVRGEHAAAEPASATVRYWLIWEGRQVALLDGENIVGRAPDASIWIDAPGVSRHHARIVLTGFDATIEDLKSKNGTYVGDKPVISPHRLADGDQIRLGPVVITFRIPPPVGSTDTAPGR
jgi:DNA-binding winged helix-turn-helix (wHTH) protein